MNKLNGSRLMEIRTKKGLTLRQAAKGAKVSLTVLWNIEQGNHSPRVETAVRLAKFYRKPVEKLWKAAA